jgi:hypothetical protein
MVARTRPEPCRLVVTLERDGEEPIRIEAPNGRSALLRGVGLLLSNDRLRAGDRLTVEAATDG